MPERRFVGREFLVFLWFESELFDGLIPVDGFGPCEVRLEGFITLSEGKEQARLQGAAQPGMVCVSQSTYEAVKGRFEFAKEEGREEELKGVGKVRMWDVQGRKTG